MSKHLVIAAGWVDVDDEDEGEPADSATRLVVDALRGTMLRYSGAVVAYAPNLYRDQRFRRDLDKLSLQEAYQNAPV